MKNSVIKYKYLFLALLIGIVFIWIYLNIEIEYKVVDAKVGSEIIEKER